MFTNLYGLSLSQVFRGSDLKYSPNLTYKALKDFPIFDLSSDVAKCQLIFSTGILIRLLQERECVCYMIVYFELYFVYGDSFKEHICHIMMNSCPAWGSTRDGFITSFNWAICCARVNRTQNKEYNKQFFLTKGLIYPY